MSFSTTTACPFWATTRIAFAPFVVNLAQCKIDSDVATGNSQLLYYSNGDMSALGCNQERWSPVCCLPKIDVGNGGDKLFHYGSMSVGDCCEERSPSIFISNWCRTACLTRIGVSKPSMHRRRERSSTSWGHHWYHTHSVEQHQHQQQGPSFRLSPTWYVNSLICEQFVVSFTWFVSSSFCFAVSLKSSWFVISSWYVTRWIIWVTCCTCFLKVITRFTFDLGAWEEFQNLPLRCPLSNEMTPETTTVICSHFARRSAERNFSVGSYTPKWYTT